MEQSSNDEALGGRGPMMARDALVTLIHTLIARAGRSSVDVLIDYSSEFKESLFDNPVSGSGNFQRLIVLWGATPQDASVLPVETRPYLTPCELGLIWAAESWLGKNEPPSFQMLILDLGLDLERRSLLYEILQIRTRGSRCEDWLQYYAPSEVELFRDALVNPPKAVGAWPSPALVRAVTAAFVRGDVAGETLGTHHDIANLIGPQLLLEAMQVPVSVEGHRAAVRRLIGSIFDEGQGLEATPGPWISAESADEWQRLGLTPVLLDDMARFGWSEFLTAALGNAAHGLRVLETAQDLEVALDEADFFAEKVLFCDLRLFAGRIAEGVGFLNDLLEIVRLRKLQGSGRESNWPALPDAAVVQQNEIEQLTLLPRILAHRFPTLPIVVFSSTQQLGVAKALAGYPTIILQFAKPSWQGERAREILRCHTDFGIAISRALSVARLRDRLAVLDTVPAIATSSEMAPAHVEIYIDESGPFNSSGSPRSTVGGLVISYPSAAAAREFMTLLSNEGVSFGYHRDEPHPLKSHHNFLPKNAPSPQKFSRLQQIETLALQHNIEIARVAVSTDEPVATHNASVDGGYFDTLVSLLGLVFASWSARNVASASVFIATRQAHISPAAALGLARSFGLPVWIEVPDDEPGRVHRVLDYSALALHDSDFEACVVFARPRRRMEGGEVGRGPVPLIAASDVGDAADLLVADKILAPAEDIEAAYTSFDQGAAHHVVTQALAGIGSAGANWSFDNCIGVTLRHYAKRDGRIAKPQPWEWVPRYCRPRLLHYAVDWVLKSRDESVVPDDWKVRGFQEQLRDANRLISVTSKIARRDFASALRILTELGTLDYSGQRSFARKVAFSTLRRSLGRTTSAEFSSLLRMSQ